MLHPRFIEQTQCSFRAASAKQIQRRWARSEEMETVMHIDPAAGLPARAFHFLSRSLRIRHAERHLAELPDFLLRDIGLGRGEIASVVRGSRMR